MKLLFDFFPIVLFFIGYKTLGIYYATAIAMIASLLQLVIYRIKYKTVDKIQLASFLMVLVLGGLTLTLQNPWFIKWKPTVIYWLFAVVLLASGFIGQKPAIQRMFEQNIPMPNRIWKYLNLVWVLFFTVMGLLNLYVAYEFSTNIWVNFKLFGGIGITMLFVFAQGLFLARYIEDNPVRSPSSQRENHS